MFVHWRNELVENIESTRKKMEIWEFEIPEGMREGETKRILKDMWPSPIPTRYF